MEKKKRRKNKNRIELTTNAAAAGPCRPTRDSQGQPVGGTALPDGARRRPPSVRE